MPWVPVTIWYGTIAEAGQLAKAIENNCPSHALGCTGCGAHALMVDQRAADGLLFARWMLEQLRREEFSRARR